MAGVQRPKMAQNFATAWGKDFGGQVDLSK
jgi:hypothetical protein